MKNYLLQCLFLIPFITFSQTFTKLNDPVINSKSGDYRSVSLVDYDNNHTLDIFIGNGGQGPNALFVNNGDSTFTNKSSDPIITQTSQSGFSFWADIDNDCDLDVYWTTVSSFSPLLFTNNGDGTFTRLTNSSLGIDLTSGVASPWADVNNDGKIDIVVAGYNSNSNYLYKNTGNSNFSRIDTGVLANSTGDHWAASWADYDKDGDPDLFLGNYNGNNYLLKNNGNGSFVNQSTSIITQEGIGTNSSTWGDYNNDGNLDLFVGRHSYSNLLYLNNGNGTFTKITSTILDDDILKSGASSWADLDNDGDLDLYVSHTGNGVGYSNRNIIYINNGNGSFSKVTSGDIYQETYGSVGCATVDINNDGFIDILDANRFNVPISIFLNNGNSNNFIKLSLYGNSSNYMAVGSRIEITSNLGKQIRYIGQESRNSIDYETHFGLGTDTIIDTLKIFWPAGGSCIITNVPVNSFYNIGEGSCVLDSTISPSFRDSSNFLNAFFNNQTIGAASAYEWDFGDGNLSTQANPQHKYSQPGTYEVTLKVFDNYCRHRIYTDSITICPDTSQLGFINTTLNLQAAFSDTSITAAHAWYWDFGDGNNDSGKVANHVYAATGTYNVCLTLTDSCRSKQICRTIQICNTNLAANFTDSINGKLVQFTDGTNAADSIYWTFGDGSSSTQINPTHVYTTPGTYFACVTAFDNCSSTTYCDSIEICPDVTVAGFAYSSNQTLVNFTDNSQFADSWLWDFGDGNFSTQQNPVNFYATYGIYTVCLTSSSDCYTDSICQTINLCPYQAQASYTYSKGVVPTAVQFNNTSVDAVSYHWDFGDGSTSIQKNPLKVFANAQVYNVCLTVTDSCGNASQYCEALNVASISLDEQLIIPIQVFPNPVSDLLTIDIGTIRDGEITIQIFDLSSKMLINEHLILNNQKKVILDIQKFSRGNYILKVKINSAERNFRITKF